jgi:hypothetical protein
MLTTAIGVLVRPVIELGLAQSKQNSAITEKAFEQGLTPAPDTGAYVVKFYRSSDLRPMKHALKDARDAVERYTQPWDKEWRLLYNVDFDQFTEAVQKASEKLSQAATEFKDRLTNIIEDNRTRLGECFDSRFYPSEATVLDFPKIKVEYRNITEADKRVTSMEELSKIKREVEGTLTEKKKDAGREESQNGMSLEDYLAQETVRRESDAALKASKKKRSKSGAGNHQASFTFYEEGAPVAAPEVTVPDAVVVDELAGLDHLACYAG